MVCTLVLYILTLVFLSQAHQLAAKHLNPEEVSRMYVGQAQELEEQGSFKASHPLFSMLPRL